MNAWQQVEWIAAEALNHLQDALVITQLCGRDKTADFNVKPNGYAVGSSVDIRNNPVYQAKEFTSAIEIQGIRSSKRTMTIEKHFDVSVKMTAKEKRLDMDSFSDQVIKPAMYAIAESCDLYVGTKILEGAGLYTSTEIFADAADMALAKRAATLQRLSATGRFCLLNDLKEAQLLGKTYFGTYNNRGTSGERVFNEGSMGKAMGMEFFSTINFPVASNTPGNGAGTTNNGAGGNTDNQVGSSTLVIDAASGTYTAGNRIKIAGVRTPLIVKTTNVVGAGPSAASIALVDPITEIIPDNAAVTIISTGNGQHSYVGAIFDDASIAVACPVLDPASDKPSAIMTENGYSIRIVQGYDMTAKTETVSLDLLIGATAYDPRRITLLGEF
jgi:hypothetical protein